jgi:hypothetical protein
MDVDLNFLQIAAYSIRKKKYIPDPEERAVRFHDDGTPIWDDLLKVADFILFLFDVDNYEINEEHELTDGFWTPYTFYDPHMGECLVRAWPSGLSGAPSGPNKAHF